MDYLQILQDSLRIFQKNKLVWIFGILSLLGAIPLNTGKSTPFGLECILLILLFIRLIISNIASGSLIYIIHQATLNQSPIFSKAWAVGKSRFFRILGVTILCSPFVFIIYLFSNIFSSSTYASPILWLIYFFGNSFFRIFLVFGYCAVVINNVNGWRAAWTSFLIVIRKYFRIFVLTMGIELTRLLVIAIVIAILSLGSYNIGLPTSFTINYSTYMRVIAIPIVSWANWIFSLFIFTIETIILTLVYMGLTKNEHSLIPPSTSPSPA